MVFADSKDPKIVANMLPTSFGDKVALNVLFGTPKGRPRRAFRQLLAALGSPGALQERPWSGSWASRARPERVPRHPRNSFERPTLSKIDFSSIFSQIWLDFPCFFERFFLDLSFVVLVFGNVSWALIRVILVWLGCLSVPNTYSTRPRSKDKTQTLKEKRAGCTSVLRLAPRGLLARASRSTPRLASQCFYPFDQAVPT